MLETDFRDDVLTEYNKPGHSAYPPSQSALATPLISLLPSVCRMPDYGLGAPIAVKSAFQHLTHRSIKIKTSEEMSNSHELVARE